MAATKTRVINSLLLNIKSSFTYRTDGINICITLYLFVLLYIFFWFKGILFLDTLIITKNNRFYSFPAGLLVMVAMNSYKSKYTTMIIHISFLVACTFILSSSSDRTEISTAIYSATKTLITMMLYPHGERTSFTTLLILAKINVTDSVCHYTHTHTHVIHTCTRIHAHTLYYINHFSLQIMFLSSITSFSSAVLPFSSKNCYKLPSYRLQFPCVLLYVCICMNS